MYPKNSPKNQKNENDGNRPKSPKLLNIPKSPKNPKPAKSPRATAEAAKIKAVVDSTYGNIFPVAQGGSDYNTATKLNKNTQKTFIGTITPLIKTINVVIEPRGYRLIKEIGTGNYANVYSVVDKKNKIVAIKVINLVKASNNYKLKFLPRELRVMSRVRHPNIISIYEILQSSNAIYVVMEYAPNGTVAEYLHKNGAIGEAKAKSMFKCILKAIHYMHSNGISHRDIKVENIIFDYKMSPKVTDFSYSKAEDLKKGCTRDLSRTFCGSLPYLPPEILQQQSYDPLISDVWSLGITLYIMVCDSLPFSIKNLTLMLDNQKARNWKFHQKVASVLSNSAKDIVSKMLEPDVKKRKTTTSLLLHNWVK